MSFPPNNPQKIELNTRRLTTIIGENLDVGDGERNGVGKSAIIDALLYLYFGKSPRISNQGFLNYIEPGPLLVVGEASRDGIAFRVERGEAPSLLRLFEKAAIDTRDFRHRDGGKFIFETTKSSKPETSKRIIELLGFDLKLADVLLVNNPSDRACFFLKTEDEQRNIVERIFGFTLFTEKADRLRELRKDENKNLLTKESALIATKQANDRVLARITDLEEKSSIWAAERDKLTRFLAQQINSYNNIDFDHEIAVLSQCRKALDQLSQAELATKSHEQSLAALQQRHDAWNSQQIDQIGKLTAFIEKLKLVDATAEIEIIETRLELQQQLAKLTADLEAAKREREPYQQSLETTHISRSRLTKQVEVTEQQIMQLDESKCPTCGQEWADTKDHILESIAELDTQHAEIAQLDVTLIELKSKIKAIDNQTDRVEIHVTGLIAKLDELPATTFARVEDAARASSGLAEHMHNLKAAQQAENPHREVMDQIVSQIAACHATRETLRQHMTNLPLTHYQELEQATEGRQSLTTLEQQLTELQQAENPHRDTIDKLRAEALAPVDEDEIKALRSKVEHMTLLISLLADRDSPIRKAVMDEWVPELNSRVSSYLESLELPHKVVFDADMTAAFTVKDKQLGFGNLSTGQRLRVWLATWRAFREIFEMINFPINLLFVDEVLDKGMSSRGAEVSYRLLEQIVAQQRTVYLITHRSELVDMADHTLLITLENGLSALAA